MVGFAIETQGATFSRDAKAIGMLEPIKEDLISAIEADPRTFQGVTETLYLKLLQSGARSLAPVAKMIEILSDPHLAAPMEIGSGDTPAVMVRSLQGDYLKPWLTVRGQLEDLLLATGMIEGRILPDTRACLTFSPGDCFSLDWIRPNDILELEDYKGRKLQIEAPSDYPASSRFRLASAKLRDTEQAKAPEAGEYFDIAVGQDGPIVRSTIYIVAPGPIPANGPSSERIASRLVLNSADTGQPIFKLRLSHVRISPIDSIEEIEKAVIEDRIKHGVQILKTLGVPTSEDKTVLISTKNDRKLEIFGDGKTMSLRDSGWEWENRNKPATSYEFHLDSPPQYNYFPAMFPGGDFQVPIFSLRDAAQLVERLATEMSDVPK